MCCSTALDELFEENVVAEIRATVARERLRFTIKENHDE